MLKKCNQKFHAVVRISKYLNEQKLKTLMSAFITSQFNYCPLLWMFYNRTFNNKINKLHERARRIVYTDKNSTFQELLEKDNAVTIHQRNLQRLAIEMYKVKSQISPLPVQEMFKVHNYDYELRKKRCWETSNVKTVHYGTETVLFRGTKIWEMISAHIKESTNLNVFKTKIK